MYAGNSGHDGQMFGNFFHYCRKRPKTLGKTQKLSSFIFTKGVDISEQLAYFLTSARE